MQIINVSNSQQIKTIAELAATIWNEHFTPIIGQAQVDYMLKQFQSEAAIALQIESGFNYFLLNDNIHAIGYTAVRAEQKALFLSKLYVLLSERNKGYGRQTIAFLQKLGIEQGSERIFLTVNKNNTDTINAYLNMGFSNTGSVVKDIGDGYVMDDFIMEKQL